MRTRRQATLSAREEVARNTCTDVASRYHLPAAMRTKSKVPATTRPRHCGAVTRRRQYKHQHPHHHQQQQQQRTPTSYTAPDRWARQAQQHSPLGTTTSFASLRLKLGGSRKYLLQRRSVAQTIVRLQHSMPRFTWIGREAEQPAVATSVRRCPPRYLILRLRQESHQVLRRFLAERSSHVSKQAVELLVELVRMFNSPEIQQAVLNVPKSSWVLLLCQRTGTNLGHVVVEFMPETTCRPIVTKQR